jgi:hypothetical protein
MKKVQKLFSNPIYLLLGFLIVVLTYMYLNSYSYDIGKKMGEDIVESYSK